MISKISPSMMCAEIIKIKETLSAFEESKIEYLHIDIMDGEFVPNFTLGTDYCKSLRKHTNIPLDIHLMIEKPDEKINYFEFSKGDIVSIHVETTKHLQRVLAKIREKGARPFAAINPTTPLCFIENVLPDIDGVLIMTVNPGFAGQKLIKQTLEKITKLRTYLDDNGYENVEIEVDGNVSPENAKLMKKAGANIFVAGSSSVFVKEKSLTEAVRDLRNAVNE